MHLGKISIYDSPLLEAWKFKELRSSKKDNTVVVHLTGRFNSFDVDYSYTVAANRCIDVGCTFKNLPALDTTGMVSKNGDPLDLEIGIKF